MELHWSSGESSRQTIQFTNLEVQWSFSEGPVDSLNFVKNFFELIGGSVEIQRVQWRDWTLDDSESTELTGLTVASEDLLASSKSELRLAVVIQWTSSFEVHWIRLESVSFIRAPVDSLDFCRVQ